MILDNFKDVHEEHNVNVTFTEVEIPVPITGKSNSLWIITLVIVSIIGVITIPSLFLKRKEN